MNETNIETKTEEITTPNTTVATEVMLTAETAEDIARTMWESGIAVSEIARLHSTLKKSNKKCTPFARQRETILRLRPKVKTLALKEKNRAILATIFDHANRAVIDSDSYDTFCRDFEMVVDYMRFFAAGGAIEQNSPAGE